MTTTLERGESVAIHAAPRWFAWPAAVGAALLVLPLVAMAVRIDWREFPALVTSPAALEALGLSARTVGASTVLCVVLGLPVAFTLARMRSRWATGLRTLVLVPLVLPPVVGGLGLLYAFGRRGLLGGTFEAWGVEIAFTTSAVVLAQTFVAMPFLILTVEGALRSKGLSAERTAATLGASPWRTWRTVTLVQLWPALISGVVLAAARALGEFGATLTFAGSLPAVTRTVPLEIYLQRESDADAAVALSFVLVLVALVVVALGYGRVARVGAHR